MGDAPAALEPALEPVFTYQVLLPAGTDAHTALRMLRQLEEEEPQLHVVWNERLREIHVQLMGVMQRRRDLHRLRGLLQMCHFLFCFASGRLCLWK